MTDKIAKHTALISTQDIADICRPLNKFDISYFSHVRVDKNGSFAGLSNHPRFSEYYLRNKYYNADIHMAEKNSFGQFVLWDALERSGETEKMDKEAEEFGIRHTFTIIENNKECSDFYHFSTHLDSKAINQVYMANLDLLKLFTLYFKENMRQSKSLSAIYDITFSLEQNSEGFSLKSTDNISNNQIRRSEFMRNMSIENTLSSSQMYIEANNLRSMDLSQFNTEELSSKFCTMNFSKRELECLLLTVRGKPAKQVSYELGLSRRTVEEYLNNIKVKMNVFSKAELIEKAIRYFNP
jgi:DNA-binding CsgD family transcriptional regulator